MALKLSSQGTLIHPARFLFNAGKTPKAWNKKMLSNKHYKVVDYWENSMEVFPSVDVKGGIATSYWNKKVDFGGIGFFSSYEELRFILSTIQEAHAEPFSNIVAPRELYRLTEILYDQNPGMLQRQSAGHKYSLGANVFSVFPELFVDKIQESNMARVYGRVNNQRCYKWCKRNYITHPDNFSKYKVIVPKSNGSGAFGEVLSRPTICEPFVGYTDTFIGIGNFSSEKEASACMKYIKTKFLRALLGTLKVTQDNPKESWQNIPLQDFTTNSDIDWSKEISDIDQQLYRKYGLSTAEINFIEEKVKPMN